jgi:hypothetical protein
MWRRRIEIASSVEAGKELAPVGRVMCKRGEDLARRSVHIDGGKKADRSGVEVIQIDGFAGEDAKFSLLASGKEYTDPAGKALAIEQVVAQIRLVPSPTAPPAGTQFISTRVSAS